MRTNGTIQLYPFLRIALCLIAGIVVGDATADCVPVLLWQWLFVGLFLTLFILYRSNRAVITQTVLLFCLMTVGGAWRVSYYERGFYCGFTGEEERYEAVVVSPPVEKKRSFKCELAIVSGRLVGHRVNAYFQKPRSVDASHALQGLRVGDGVEVSSVFEGFDDDYSAQQGGFDWKRQRMVRGIVARTFVASADWNRAEVSLKTISYPTRLMLKLQSLRTRLLQRLRSSGVAEEAYATLAAMTLGDKTALSAELRDTYSRAGVSHVLALSGLHLGIIYAMLALLLGRWRNTVLGFVATVSLIWLFALMVGMSPGIVRSAAMFSLYALMALLSRETITLNSLAAAAFFILAASPAMLWDVGFQMSFLAVAGIVLCNGCAEELPFYDKMRRRRFWGKLFSLCFVSLSAQVFVLPLVMYYFGRIPLYFLLSNLVAIPLTSVVIYASFLLFVLSPLCVVSGVLGMVWQWLANGVGWLAGAMNTTLAWIASLPGASIDGAYINTAQLFVLYALTAALFGVGRYCIKMWISAYGTFRP